MQHIVIIGGGIAGTSAAQEIRAKNKEVEITIVEREANILYSRVLLPHYIKDVIPREKVFLKTLQWYEEQQITLLTSTEATMIDAKNTFVSLSDGRELPFDELIIATGTEPRMLSSDARGVAYLYTLADADHVKALLQEMYMLPLEERRATIYGGGFIACEFANAFAKFSIPFTMVLRGSGFWSRSLSNETQSFLHKYIEARGVRLIVNEPEPELVRDGDHLCAIRLQNGEEIVCRMLGVGIGVSVDTMLPDEAGIETDAGIVADEHLQTSQKGVYTAGDAAFFADARVGRHISYGNWLNAQMQGKDLGSRLAGGEAVLRPVSQYATDLLGCKIVFIGDVQREKADRIEQIKADSDGCEEYFFRAGKFVGAILVGDVSKRGELVKQIGIKQI